MPRAVVGDIPSSYHSYWEDGLYPSIDESLNRTSGPVDYTTRFPISRDLKKPVMLPNRRAWSIHENDCVVAGRVICYTRWKSWLMTRKSSTALRHAAITRYGFLVIYETDDKGYVIDVRQTLRLTSEHDIAIERKRAVRRCKLSLKLPFGSVHLMLIDDVIRPWSEAVSAFYDGRVPSKYPSIEQIQPAIEARPCQQPQEPNPLPTENQPPAISPARNDWTPATARETPSVVSTYVGLLDDDKDDSDDLSSFVSVLESPGERASGGSGQVSEVEGAACCDNEKSDTCSIKSLTSVYVPVSTMCKRIEQRLKNSLRWKKKDKKASILLKKYTTEGKLLCEFPPVTSRRESASFSCRSCVSRHDASLARSEDAISSRSSLFSRWSLPNMPQMSSTPQMTVYLEEYPNTLRRKTIAVCDCGQSFA